jgi:hypothetical protein
MFADFLFNFNYVYSQIITKLLLYAASIRQMQGLMTGLYYPTYTAWGSTITLQGSMTTI